MNKLCILFFLLFVGFGLQADETTNLPTAIEVSASSLAASDMSFDIMDPLELCAGQLMEGEGNSVCIPITSTNFTDILSFEFSMHYDPAVLMFNGVSGVQPNLTPFANGSSGDIIVIWSAPTENQGVTITPGDAIFEVCFTTIGILGQSSAITFDGTPRAIDIVSETSNQMDIGIQPKDGMVVIGNPPTDLIIGAITSTENIVRDFCVDITVSDFEDMVSMQYSINWDPSILEHKFIARYSLLESPINVNIYDPVDGDITIDGDITVSWFANGTPVTIPDNSVLFQLCFDVIGSGCTDITFSGDPLFEQVVKNSGGINTFVDLNDTPGSFCTNPDPFVLADATIFNIDCDTQFGTIDVDYGGGVAPFTAMWSHGPTTFDVSNLPAGIFTTTVTDAAGSSFIETFEILDLTIDPGTCDDGDCTNGLEIWAGCECVTGTTPVDPGCDDGDCSNGLEMWDGCGCVAGTVPVNPGCDDGDCSNGLEMWDGCGCVDGTAPVDPGCDDGDCNNGIEMWDGCDCVAGTVPVDPGCDDGDCSNGIEMWDGCDCVAGAAPVDPGCDDGDCNNGVEMWDGCGCVAGTVPVDPGCDDGDCSNGLETWDGCGCVAGTAPINPGNCDDGDCSNGIEGWDGCECVVITMTELGCTNATATNFDSQATCDDGSCVFACPDPGDCSDGDCSNGLEFWNGTACECEMGTIPVDPGCDDGDCSNGLEMWDGCDCVAGTAPVNPGCDDGDCNNGMETWDGCGCVAGTVPVNPGCDDGDCSNGLETWDGCGCIAGTAPVDPGTCDDGDCENGIEGWDGCECVVVTMTEVGCTNATATNFDSQATCDDGSCVFACPDPGDCSDGDCSNGLEFWNGTACECEMGTIPVDPGCDDGDCSNGLETWDGCDCVAGTAPVDPGTCDDGDCTNGIEGWDGCECVVIDMPLLGCTNISATNYNSQATCDDGSCMDACVDPGCDDGDCTNGLEVWDAGSCECVTAQSSILIIPDVSTNITYCEGDNIPMIELANATASFSVNWYDENSLLLFVGDQFEPTLAGNYFVGVVQLSTGCEGELIPFEVAALARPVAVADGAGELNCLISELTLNGVGSSSGTGFTTTWSTNNGVISAGENTLSPTVTASGDYLLTVMDNTTMCTSEALITITENFEQPVAIAANETENIECNLSLILDASNSTSDGNLTYQWSTVGGNILSGGTTLTPEVNESGEYQLVIFNNDNFCTASTTVNVIGTPPVSGANAGFDEILCTTNAIQLEADLISPLTGTWTGPNNGSFINDDTNPNSNVNNLAPGENVFFWTVSTPDCPDFDQDSVVVTVESLPMTNDDFFEMDELETRQSFNVGLNDEFFSIDNWTFNFLSNPQDGVVTFPGGGIVTYELPPNVFGEQQFTYEICNDFCLEHCDSATVIIDVIDPLVVRDTVINFPNTITPNGDGQNDFFVLDVLIENPDKFLDNDLVIFNRWGDVVFQAKPYNNDWDGVNSKGFDLPQGTYFYVVRLDIAEGDILRGAITILK